MRKRSRGFWTHPRCKGGPKTMLWTGHCLECSAIWKLGYGLFCGNYLLARGNYPLCRSVWCDGCYRESPNNNFPRLDHLQSGSDLEVDEAYAQSCYPCGRNGDHLMGYRLSAISALFERGWPRPRRHGCARRVHSHGHQASALGRDVGKEAQHSGLQLCENIPTWISLCVTTVFNQQGGISILKFPKRFSEISWAEI